MKFDDSYANITFCTEDTQLVNGVTMTKSVSCYGGNSNHQFSQPKVFQKMMNNNIANMNDSRQKLKKKQVEKLLLDSSQSQKSQKDEINLSYQLSKESSLEKSFYLPKNNQNIAKSVSYLENIQNHHHSHQLSPASVSIAKQSTHHGNSPSITSNKYIRSTKGQEQLNSSLSRNGIKINAQKIQKVFQQQTKKKIQKQWDSLFSFDQTLLKCHSLGTLDRCQSVQQKIKKILAIEEYCRIKNTIGEVSQCMNQILTIVTDVEKQRTFLQKKLDDCQQSNIELVETLQYLRDQVEILSKEVQLHKQSGKLQSISGRTNKNDYLSQEKFDRNQQTPMRCLSQMLPERKFSHSIKQINILRISQEQEELNNEINVQSWVQFVYILKEKLNKDVHDNVERKQFIDSKLINKIAKSEELCSWIRQIQQKIDCLVAQKAQISQNQNKNIPNEHFISSQFTSCQENFAVMDQFIEASHARFLQLEKEIHNKIQQKVQFQQINKFYLKYFTQALLSTITFTGILINASTKHQTQKSSSKQQKTFKRGMQSKSKQINGFYNNRKDNDILNLQKDKDKRIELFLKLLQRFQFLYNKYCQKQQHQMKQGFKMLTLYVLDVNHALG